MVHGVLEYSEYQVHRVLRVLRSAMPVLTRVDSENDSHCAGVNRLLLLLLVSCSCCTLKDERS